MINQRYKIEELLGIGRSKTFLCTDTFYNDKKMAMKILPSRADSKEERTFKEEFLTLRKLSHKNIIKAFDYRTIITIDETCIRHGILQGSKFFTMEYVEGNNIFDFYNKISEDLLVELLTQILKALLYLHTFNYIYKDLKIENILVSGTFDEPRVFLVDFGAVISSIELRNNKGYGTNSYLAPEYLFNPNATVDKRVDLYALGVLFYFLIYGYFPFNKESNVKLFRAHIDEEPEYPISPYSDKFIGVVQKLLKKNPEERFQNSHEILEDLGCTDSAGVKDWFPPKVFVRNNLMMSLVNDYLYSKKVDQAIIIRGPEGSGKTSLLDEIYYNFRYIINIYKSDANTNREFWSILLQKILFNPYLYSHIDDVLTKRIVSAIQFPPENPIDEIKILLIEICKKNKFIIEFDDFNEYSEKALEFLREVVPIFLIYEIKVIIVENSELKLETDFIEAALIRITQPFDENQLKEHLHKTFSSEIDYKPILTLLSEKTDLQPGSVDYLLRELFYKEVLVIKNNKLVLSNDAFKLEQIELGFEKSLMQKIEQLSEQEVNLVQILSALGISITSDFFLKLLKVCNEFLEETIRKLTDKNILKEYYDGEIEFCSNAVKRKIYDSIENKSKLHSQIAETLSLLEDCYISKIEIANQYEKGGNPHKSFSVLLSIAEAKENSNSFSYLKEILERAVELKTNSENISKAEAQLCGVYLSLGDFNNALTIVNKIIEDKDFSEVELGILLFKAEALKGVGKIDAAKELYLSVVSKSKNLKDVTKARCEIADIEFMLKNYNVAENICLEIIQQDKYDLVFRANSYNLLGIIKSEQQSYTEAIECFNEAIRFFNTEKKFYQALKAEINIGSLYATNGSWDRAKYHWEKAQEKNRQVGSLDFEANLFLNYGVYFLEELELEESIDNYLNSLNILNKIGRKELQDVVITNLSETYLLSCEYDNAISILGGIEENSKNKHEVFELSEFYYLKGCIYVELGAKKEFENILLEFEKLNTKMELLERAKLNLLHLRLLANSFTDDSFPINEIESLRSDSFALFYKNLYMRSCILEIKTLINLSKFESAMKILTSENLLKQIGGNPYYQAYHNFLLGNIQQSGKIKLEQSSFEYLEKAYSLIVDNSITELTWEITFALAEVYTTRGNLSKASEYITLTQQLIQHIAGNISDASLRHDYLNKRKRKSVLEKLAIWKEYLV